MEMPVGCIKIPVGCVEMLVGCIEMPVGCIEIPVGCAEIPVGWDEMFEKLESPVICGPRPIDRGCNTMDPLTGWGMTRCG